MSGIHRSSTTFTNKGHLVHGCFYLHTCNRLNQTFQNRSLKVIRSLATIWRPECGLPVFGVLPVTQPTTHGRLHARTRTITAAFEFFPKPPRQSLHLRSISNSMSFDRAWVTTRGKKRRILGQSGRVVNGTFVTSQTR